MGRSGQGLSAMGGGHYIDPTEPYESGCYTLTPWSRVLCEKLTGFQIVKKFPAYHGTRMFITTFTSVNLCEHFVTR